jgi:anti-anti-sigma factor
LTDRTPVPGHCHTPAAQRATDLGAQTGRQPAAAGDSVGVSATVAGFDGVVIGTVTRHREAGQTDPAHRQELIVVSVIGDLDADTGPLLHIALTEALDTNPSVCCDLRRVTFFGAAGANTVLAAHLRAAASGRQFTVRGVHGMTRLVLAITGVHKYVDLHPLNQLTGARSGTPDESGRLP